MQYHLLVRILDVAIVESQQCGIVPGLQQGGTVGPPTQLRLPVLCKGCGGGVGVARGPFPDVQGAQACQRLTVPRAHRGRKLEALAGPAHVTDGWEEECGEGCGEECGRNVGRNVRRNAGRNVGRNVGHAGRKVGNSERKVGHVGNEGRNVGMCECGEVERH